MGYDVCRICQSLISLLSEVSVGHSAMSSPTTLQALVPALGQQHALSCAWRGATCGEQGRIFIDRDGRWFRLVLNFLRDGGCELPESSVDCRELLREADYYQARFVWQAQTRERHVVYRALWGRPLSFILT